MPTITIHDQTTAGQDLSKQTLIIPTETLTVRELIRSRVYQEVEDFNRNQRQDPATRFHGLVQPNGTEVTLNGYQLKDPRQLDWNQQFEKACDAFSCNRILILVDRYQATDLDETVTLCHNTEITFLKLVPLVGG